MKRSISPIQLDAGENKRASCCEEEAKAAVGVQDVVSIQQFRSGICYESPGDYSLSDMLPPRDEIVGTYDYLWSRFSCAVPTFFNYHRTVKGTIKVSFITPGSNRFQIEFNINSSFDDLPFKYLKKYSAIEKKEGTKGSGLIIDGVVNFSGSHQDADGEIAGGFALLGQSVAIGMKRDGYEVGIEFPPVFDSRSEAIEANRRYFDGRNSWLYWHKNLPPEIVIRVRMFVHAQPALIWEKDDLLIRTYWVNKKGEHITHGSCCRKRKS